MTHGDLLPGRYACVRTGGFYSWLIRAGTRSEYSHAFIVCPGGRIIEEWQRIATAADQQRGQR